MPSADDRPSVPPAAGEPLRTLVAGLSLDRESDTVLKTAARVARAAGARLHLVHTIELEPIRGHREGKRLVTGSYQELLERCRRQVVKRAAELGVADDEIGGVTVELLAPHRALLRAASDTGAGLLVVGAHRPGAPLGRLLGSTADRVMRKASCPALILRGELPVPPRRVLAPVDLSPLSADSLRRGLSLLGRIAGGSPLTVECLYVEPGHRPAGDPAGTGRVTSAELERFARDQEGAAGGEVTIETAVRSGEVAAEILAQLAAAPADLVLLGTHGWGGFERFLLGSVATAVVREAPVSVLVVPPAAAGAQPAPARSEGGESV